MLKATLNFCPSVVQLTICIPKLVMGSKRPGASQHYFFEVVNVEFNFSIIKTKNKKRKITEKTKPKMNKLAIVTLHRNFYFVNIAFIAYSLKKRY